MSSITDSLLVERALPHVPPPLWAYMSTGVLFNRPTETQPRSMKMKTRGQYPINIAALKVHLLKEGRVKPDDAYFIMACATEILKAEKNLLQLREPVIVVGDIHGQFYDLVKLLEIGGMPSPEDGRTYLFLGDYVDRGCFSCECVLLLLALKCCFPQNVFLLRGNHEARHLTTYFNFKTECQFKYSQMFYSKTIDAFDALPLASLVGSRFFCVHGGLSPDVTHVEDIQHIHRFREVPSGGAMCDLLWSDPHWDVENPSPSSSDGLYNLSTSASYEMTPSFTPNDQRGCSYVFNFACLKHFITENSILCVVRAHEAQDEGYRLYRSHPNTHFPALLTVFSAPNYCDTYDNKGAIVLLSEGKMNIKQFFSSPHPYYLPNFMNALTWSGPFVSQKVRAAMASILLISAAPSCDEDSDIFTLSEADEKEVQADLVRLGIMGGRDTPPPPSVRSKMVSVGGVVMGVRGQSKPDARPPTPPNAQQEGTPAN